MAQTKPKAGQFYGVSDNGTDGQFLKTDGTGGMSWASTIVDPTITSIDYPGTQTAADPAGGESVIINGTLFASGITCAVGGTSAVTAFNSATQITITTPAKAAGQYAVAVTNSDGGTASQVNFIQYSGVPVWSTASGSLGNVLEGEAASFQVTATEGSDTIEYAVTTGTLPTGLSLNTATGAITGTAPAVSADTTTTFSITATDDENQTSSERSFSITVQNDLPSNHFNTVLYTGNGGSQNIDTVGFTPDLVWIKNRNDTNPHALFDSVRTAGKLLVSNTTAAETGNSGDLLGSFRSLGFQVNRNYLTNTAYDTTNGTSSLNYVAWNFKAGGAAVANTDGTINSQVSVNNTLGFSIVSYTGNNVAGATIGHGLGAAPDMIILKNRDTTDSWTVQTSDLTYTDYIDLNSTNAATTNSSVWYAAPTSNVFSFGANPRGNGSGNSIIAYCFASKPGFSKVGSYTGNGSASGPMVQTGFEPAFLMIKRTDGTAGNWFIFDNERSTTNERDDFLHPNLNAAETTNSAAYSVDFLSNGFQIKGNGDQINGNNGTHIYLAIAADGSTATPSLANSFNAVENTSPTTNQAIAAGFTPDMVWIKGYNIGSGNATSWGQYDTIRGSGWSLQSDNNAAQYNYNGHPSGDLGMEFTSTGYNTPPLVNNNVNNSSDDYINYFWKAGGTPSINTDGTITSIVSANPAAGFSVVKGTAISSGAFTVGHGLSAAPELYIIKNTSGTGSWLTYVQSLGADKYLSLNTSDAAGTSTLFWNNTAPSSTVFQMNAGQVITGSADFIAYCFTSISGYSKVGSYTGTSGSVTVSDVGFQPTFLLIKGATAGASFGGSWLIVDSARGDGGFNTAKFLSPNTSDAEFTNAVYGVTFTSNGFTIPSGSSVNLNTNNGTFIYLAIKEN